MSIYPRGMRCGPLKMLYWPKINRKRGFSRLRVTQWVLSNDPNNSVRGLTKFRLYLGKRYEPCNSLGLNPTENIMHNIHKSSIKRELPSTAVNPEINRPGVTLHFFFSKYAATHEQVTRSAPSREPNDHRDLTLTPDKIKIQCRGTPS